MFMAYYIPSLDLAFIHIPKNGGTSILSWIEENFEYKKIGPKHVDIKGFTAHKYGNVSRPRYYFSVVRNPYSRILSWFYYQEKMIEYRHKKGKPKLNDNEIKKLLESGINSAFTGSNNVMFDRYILKPQTEYIEKDVHAILRLEHLQEDFKVIQNLTNCYKTLPHINTSNNNNDISILTKSTIQKINSIYKADFEQLKYKKIDDT